MSTSVAKLKLQRRDVWLAIASFCLVGAILSHVLAAPIVARTWPTGTRTTTSVADDARVFVPGAGNGDERIRLVRETTIVERESAFAPEGATTYGVEIDVRGPDGAPVTRERRIVSQFDGDGLAANTPVNTEEVTEFNVNGDEVQQVRRTDHLSGQVLRFPKDTEARTYDLWDATTRRAWATRRMPSGR